MAVARGVAWRDSKNNSLAFLNVSDDQDLYPLPQLSPNLIARRNPIPLEKMKEAVEWIRTNIARHKVVVFCRYGRGRSASVAIGYLCTAARWNTEMLVGLVRSSVRERSPS